MQEAVRQGSHIHTDDMGTFPIGAEIRVDLILLLLLSLIYVEERERIQDE